MLARGLSFARAMWRLYDAKAGMETQFKDGLSDLGLHHPPCRKHVRNAGFYAVGALAWLLGWRWTCWAGPAAIAAARRAWTGGRGRGGRPNGCGCGGCGANCSRCRPGGAPCAGAEGATAGVGAGTRQLFERYWGNLSLC